MSRYRDDSDEDFYGRRRDEYDEGARRDSYGGRREDEGYRRDSYADGRAGLTVDSRRGGRDRYEEDDDRRGGREDFGREEGRGYFRRGEGRGRPGPARSHVRCRDIMTRDVTVATRDTTLDAIRKMGDKQVRRIPIVDREGTLRGIISMADVALETEEDRELAEALEEISSGASFWNRVFG